MLCFLWDQEGPIEQQYVGRILMDQPIYNTLGRSKTWFNQYNQYLLVNEGFATTSSMYKSFSSRFEGIWMHLAISPIRSLPDLPDPEFPHLDIAILAVPLSPLRSAASTKAEQHTS